MKSVPDTGRYSDSVRRLRWTDRQHAFARVGRCLILALLPTLLGGCFSAVQGMNEWGGKDPKARNTALAMDVATLPIQAPLFATVAVIYSPALIKKSFGPVVSLRVVDDLGLPVEGIHASFGRYRRKAGNGKPLPDELSNHDGFVSRVVKLDEVRDFPIRAFKDGYYLSELTPPHSFLPPRGSKTKNVVITVVLKRRKNPVPMYAKQVAGGVPAKNIDVGYDLVVGDWVAPHGKGKLADIFFHGTGEVFGDRNYRGELTMTFPGQGNGQIAVEVPLPQSSWLRMPYEALPESYEPKRIWRSVRKYNPVTMKDEEYINDSSKTQNFFIRVRTEMNAEGKVVKAMYGKIHAPFEFGLDTKSGLPGIRFVYYLNPDGTQNIEFDPARNLLKPAKRSDSGFQGLAP